MLTTVVHYDCELNESTIKLQKVKKFRHNDYPDSKIISFDVEKKDEYYLIHLGYINKIKQCKTERSIKVDFTKDNNDTLTKFKKLVNKYYICRGVKLEYEVTRYFRSMEPNCYDYETVGYGISITLRDGYSNELLCLDKDFSFWNTRSSKFFQDIELVRHINNSPLVKYPRTWTIPMWQEKLSYDLNMYTSIDDVIHKFIKVLNVNENYPLDLKAAIVKFYTEELKYAYMLTYQKYPTIKTKLDHTNLDRTFFLLMYRIITSYQPAGQFSYAMFISKAVMKHDKIISLFLDLLQEDYNFFFTLEEQINTKNVMKFKETNDVEYDIMKWMKINLIGYLILLHTECDCVAYDKIRHLLKHFLKLNNKLKLNKTSKRYNTEIHNQILKTIDQVSHFAYCKENFNDIVNHIQTLLVMLKSEYEVLYRNERLLRI
jgi:hypothetical protein